MAKIYAKGIERYSRMLERLGDQSEKVIKSAVYKGAAIVADEIKAGINALPIEEGSNGLSPIGTPERKLNGITRKQKGDLMDGFGLAPMQNENGYIQTKAGMDGYGSIPTKKYPKGVPNAALMRSIESGTSFRNKHPVFRQATNRVRKRAEQEMTDELDRQIQIIMK